MKEFGSKLAPKTHGKRGTELLVLSAYACNIPRSIAPKALFPAPVNTTVNRFSEIYFEEENPEPPAAQAIRRCGSTSILV
jgi:hypothetical protein